MARTSVRVRSDKRAGAILATLAAPKILKGARMVAAAQRAAIPVSRDGSYGRPAGYARSRISIRPTLTREGLSWDVGTDATTPDGYPYPLGLDRGTRAHTITSSGPWPLRNPRTGQVFGREVRHPGTKPTYWCTNSTLVLRGQRL